MLFVIKRGKLNFIILIFVFLVLNIKSVNSACCPFDPVTGECHPCPGEEDIEETITETLDAGDPVDLSQDPYTSDQDATSKALKSLFNLDLFSKIWDGLSVQGGDLKTPGGGTMNLKTGKNLKVYTDGNKVTSFDDNTGTTATDAIGLNYDSDSFSVSTAQQVTYQGTTSTNVQNFVAEQDTITASSADSFSVPGTAVGCTNCKDISFSPDIFTVSAADQVTYQTSTSTNVNSYEGKKGTFTVKTADSVTIGGNTFTNVKDSTFSVIGNKLVYADVISAKNNNTAIIENPIEGSSEDIKINYNMDDNFEVMVLDSQINFNADKGVVLNLTKITFKAGQNNANLKIAAGKPPKYSVSRGILNFIEDDFTEQITGSCDLSTAEINFNRGFKQIILSPFITTLCPGARYSYIDKKDKEKSFSILNSGKENYEIGFRKDGLMPYTLFTETLLDNSWGYVDFPELIELNGIASYERFREFKPEIESTAAYSVAQLEFMSVYSSFDYSNRAELNLINGKNAELTVTNSNVDEETDVVVEVNSAIHKIIEKQISNNIFRFENFNRQPMFPPYITKYSSNFKKDTPAINIIGKTLKRICGKQAITVFTPNTAPERAFRDKLQGWAAISYDDMLEKYGPERK